MTRRPTLVDVARLAGTSTAVVSYVVNNGPRPVSPETREKVEQAISQLNYRRNNLAGALVRGESNLIGLLVPNASNAFFGELSHEVERAARANGFLILLGNTGYDREVERGYSRAFADLNPRALITVATSEPDSDDAGPSRVYVHSAPRSTSWPSIVAADFDGARDAVEHLFAHGYPSIACATGPDDDGPAGLRLAGWEAAVRAHPGGRGSVYRVPFERVDAEAAALDILRSAERPRAVFATTDEIALAFVRAARVLNVQLPGELAVVGFDGIPEAVHGSTRLTTMVVPIHEIAVRAVEAAIGEVSEQRTVLDVTLSLGETCGSHELSA